MEQGEEVAALGTFFAVADAGDGAGWQPIADLQRGPGLDDRVEATAVALARGREPLERRAVASTAALGLLARLVSPTLAAAVLERPGPDPARLLWRPVGASVDLAAAGWTDADVAALLEGPVAGLVDGLVDEHGLSAHVVLGNVASAVHGALVMVATARPDLGPRCGSVLRAALDHPLLAGTADVGPPFVRRSCCLYYRLPGGGLCGDCVLRHR